MAPWKSLTYYLANTGVSLSEQVGVLSRFPRSFSSPTLHAHPPLRPSLSQPEIQNQFLQPCQIGSDFPSLGEINSQRGYFVRKETLVQLLFIKLYLEFHSIH